MNVIYEWFKKQWSMTAIILMVLLLITSYMVGYHYKNVSYCEEYKNKLSAELQQYHAISEIVNNSTQVIQESPVGWSMLIYKEAPDGNWVEMAIFENKTSTAHYVLFNKDSAGNMSIMYLKNEKGEVKRYGGSLYEIQGSVPI